MSGTFNYLVAQV